MGKRWMWAMLGVVAAVLVAACSGDGERDTELAPMAEQATFRTDEGEVVPVAAAPAPRSAASDEGAQSAEESAGAVPAEPSTDGRAAEAGDPDAQLRLASYALRVETRALLLDWHAAAICQALDCAVHGPSFPLSASQQESIRRHLGDLAVLLGGIDIARDVENPPPGAEELATLWKDAVDDLRTIMRILALLPDATELPHDAAEAIGTLLEVTGAFTGVRARVAELVGNTFN